jgi:formamidopyrimidine-DNA glycosylase
MPELPEVETIVRGLNQKIKGRKIIDLWTDWPKYFHPVRSGSPQAVAAVPTAVGGAASNGVRLPKNKKEFRRRVIGKKIISVERRAKNVLIHLSDNHLLLIHQKISGHLLVGKWRSVNGNWQSAVAGPLSEDRNNQYIRLIFFLNNGQMLALSDLRRFAKVLCGPKEIIFNLPGLKDLGPEPLDPKFTFKKFEELFNPPAGGGNDRIKQVLMDQNFISGIGNIYADEILWVAKIHPLARIEKLKEKDLKKIYQAMKFILKKALKLRGTSIDDYRDAEGRRGAYDKVRYVYQREDEPCSRCGTKIKRLKLGGRSAHYCPKCQK